MKAARKSPDSQHRNPARTVDATLVLSDGNSEPVHLFLSAPSGTHKGQECVDELLNQSQRFLPVQSRDTKRCFLVNRDTVERVEVAAGTAALSHTRDNLRKFDDPVCLQLVGGAVLEGTFVSSLPLEASGWSEQFSRGTPFVPLHVGDKVTYVNKSRVAAIWL